MVPLLPPILFIFLSARTVVDACMPMKPGELPCGAPPRLATFPTPNPDANGLKYFDLPKTPTVNAAGETIYECQTFSQMYSSAKDKNANWKLVCKPDSGFYILRTGTVDGARVPDGVTFACVATLCQSCVPPTLLPKNGPACMNSKDPFCSSAVQFKQGTDAAMCTVLQCEPPPDPLAAVSVLGADGKIQPLAGIPQCVAGEWKVNGGPVDFGKGVVCSKKFDCESCTAKVKAKYMDAAVTFENAITPPANNVPTGTSCVYTCKTGSCTSVASGEAYNSVTCDVIREDQIYTDGPPLDNFNCAVPTCNCVYEDDRLICPPGLACEKQPIETRPCVRTCPSGTIPYYYGAKGFEATPAGTEFKCTGAQVTSPQDYQQGLKCTMPRVCSKTNPEPSTICPKIGPAGSYPGTTGTPVPGNFSLLCFGKDSVYCESGVLYIGQGDPGSPAGLECATTFAQWSYRATMATCLPDTVAFESCPYFLPGAMADMTTACKDGVCTVTCKDPTKILTFKGQIAGKETTAPVLLCDDGLLATPSYNEAADDAVPSVRCQ